MIAQVSANLFWWGGIVLLSVLTVQALVSLGGSVQRWRDARRRQAWRDEILRSELKIARHRMEVLAESGVAWAGWRKFRVARKEPENEEQSICSFYLEPHDGRPLPTFQPGQYLTFQARLPGESRPLVRCYSLSAAPQENVYRISVRRLLPPRDSDLPPGRMSNYFHDHVNVGDILDVKAPGGSFTLDTTRTGPVVLLAGGVGITPMLSMLNAIACSGCQSECWLFYGVVHGGDQIMKHHLRRIKAEHPNIHVCVCYSSPREGVDVQGRDYDHAGRVSVDLMRQLLPSNNYDFFMCGPPPMMDALKADLDAWGVPRDRVHYEAFGPVHNKPPVKVESGAKSVEVKFVRSGKTCTWTPESGTLLQLAREHGIAVDSGCEQGDCGTCMLPIHDGEVEYQKPPGFEAEGGTCLPCVCTPKRPLELDA